MKQVNSVQLDGMVESCRIVGDVKGKTVAKLSVITLHPKDTVNASPDNLSSRYEKFRHVVRVVTSGDAARSLQMLEKELRTEKAARQPDLSSLHPCHVSGVLRSAAEGELFVDASEKGFALTDMVKTSDNNNVRISGSISSLSFSDESARIRVNTSEGVFTSFIPKSLNRSGWESVSSGKLKKGDPIVLSGPIVVSEFTDGTKSMRTCLITPHSIQKQKLEKKQGSGQVL